jgi:cysteine desulfurase/selenocysteine lyase
MNKTIDWSALRQDFPILNQQVHGQPLVYFDNAATSQKPRAVIDALVHYYEFDNANVHRGIHELSNRATTAFEAARTRTAKFINAKSADEIIFTRGTTEGINLVASSWGTKHLQAGDVILLTELEHHSNLVPWQMLAQKTGAKIAYVPVTGDEGVLDLSQLDRLLTSSVKIFSMVHISNSMGTVNPVAELCARARKLGITTLVDGAQSAGHLPVDVQAIGCDFFAFSGHKICGPTGIGVLWGRSEILESMPPYQGGGEMILTVGYHKTEFKPAPHRFEAGTPDISGPIGLHAAMDYLDAIGRENIWRHDQELANYAAEKLAAERLKKYCSRSERGFLGFGEALAKEQVQSNPVTEPKRSLNPKRPPSSFSPNRTATVFLKMLERKRAASWSRAPVLPPPKTGRTGVIATNHGILFREFGTFIKI